MGHDFQKGVDRFTKGQTKDLDIGFGHCLSNDTIMVDCLCSLWVGDNALLKWGTTRFYQPPAAWSWDGL